MEETFSVELYDNNTTRTTLLNNGRATGTIEDDDSQTDSTISVTAVSGEESFNEGEVIKFEFTANPELATEQEIMINLEETGNFLHSTVVRNRLTIPASTSTTNKYTAEYRTNDDDGEFGADSKVTLTIQTGSGYAVGSDSSASITVFDNNTPTGISVVAISGDTMEAGDQESQVVFQIKADKNSSAASARIINVSVDDGNADFLSTDSLAKTQVTIPQHEYSINLPLTIVGDDRFEIHGEIEVAIEDQGNGSANYTISSNGTASIAVYDDDYPTGEGSDSVAIRAVIATVSEANGDANGVAPFMIIPNVSKSTLRTIMVSVSDGAGDFLAGDTYNNNVPVDIPANARYAELNVNLDNDRKYETAGTITAMIQSGSGYDVAGGSHNSASIAVTSDDPDVPIITIQSSATTTGVTEGFSFDFTVMSDENITGSPLEIAFTPGYTGGGTDPNAAITGTTVSIPVGEEFCNWNSYNGYRI